MKALSIKQPWASLIAHGIKDIENRSWKTNFRGRIYIHASGKQAGSYDELLNDEQKKEFKEKHDRITLEKQHYFSAIIGEVDIIDCVINHPSIWAEKSEYEQVGPYLTYKNDKPIYNWVLANPVLYEKPILNVKGKLSFWEPDIDINECIGCSGKFNLTEMLEDSAGELYCKECADVLFPIMRKEYEEMLERGEIEQEDN
ncbi:MAG: ASCH domain-containing protein [Flavobacterium sp.]|uniref:ASCH domain-containing protein n=1 Tax=Flavobacterium sp. TaxID=239 RepID=UPI002B478A94|nr:ASCH domain-containing protein [Flavobacterium sp.]WRH74166.1 MAG: ASCH domain-containing protein [Flavobacterium sp.]